MSGNRSDPWAEFSKIFRIADQPLTGSWAELFGPLRGGAGGSMVVGQLGQSLDGRIATESGHSKYINGPAGLAHLHRLRSLVDQVTDVAKEVGEHLKEPAQAAVASVKESAEGSVATVKEEAQSAAGEVKDQAQHARENLADN